MEGSGTVPLANKNDSTVIVAISISWDLSTGAGLDEFAQANATYRVISGGGAGGLAESDAALAPVPEPATLLLVATTAAGLDREPPPGSTAGSSR